MALIHFSKDGFEKAVHSGALVMVDFWATWCGPCKMLAPVIDDIAGQYEGKNAIIGKVDVDTEQELAGAYNVTNIPTIIFFKNGQELDRKVGIMPAETYTDLLDANL